MGPSTEGGQAVRRSASWSLRPVRDMAIDLGTANTVVHVRGRGIVLSEPSGVTEVERRAVEEAARSAGARQVHLIEEPIAAAIGAGIPIAEPVGRMVVDVGGGTSEVAVISLGSIVVSRSVRAGGYDLDDAIAAHIRTEHVMAIGSQSAEAIKLAVGSAAPLATELEVDIRGRDLLSGLPRKLSLGSAEVRGAIASPLTDIMAAIHATLEETPPELAGDIVRHGILLAGGGSLLRGFVERVQNETAMNAYLADSPLTCVASGAGQSLEELDTLGRASGRRRRIGGP